MKNKNLITIGVIKDKHGLKGLVKVRWYTETINNLESYNPITLSNNEKFNLKVMSENKGLAICELDDISDANQAEMLKGEKIYADRSKFPRLKNGEYYHVDLIGCDVNFVKGDYIGKVSAVYDFGAGPILEINKELIIFNDENFPEVNVEDKLIYMNSNECREKND